MRLSWERTGAHTRAMGEAGWRDAVGVRDPESGLGLVRPGCQAGIRRHGRCCSEVGGGASPTMGHSGKRLKIQDWQRM